MERHYFGLSTLLASVALLIWSIGETFAFPQGPNVSMGSSPYESLYGGISQSSSGNNPILVNTSGYDFLVTVLNVTGGGTSDCYWRINNVNVDHFQNSGNYPQNPNFNGIVPLNLIVPDGETLALYKSSSYISPCHYYVSGHYIQK